MKKNKWLGIAVGLIAAGVILTTAAIMAGGWPGMSIDRDGIHLYSRKESGGVYELQKTELPKFSSIDLDVEYAGLQVIPSDGYYLEYCLPKSDGEPVYQVKNNTFSFGKKSQFHFMKMDFGFLVGQDKEAFVNLYVPKDAEFERFTLEMESGDVQMKDISADWLEADISYGNAFLENVTVNKGEIEVESGDLTLSEILLEQVKIQAEYGNVDVRLADGTDDYEMELETAYGDIEAPEDGRTVMEEEMVYYKKDGSGKRLLEIESESGNITVK